MPETVHFGLATPIVMRRFKELIRREGSIAKAVTNLLNRDKFLNAKYRFRSLAGCEVWQETVQSDLDSMMTLSPVLQMLDTYVRFNRLESRSAALEELLQANCSEQPLDVEYVIAIGSRERGHVVCDSDTSTRSRHSLVADVCDSDCQTDSISTTDATSQTTVVSLVDTCTQIYDDRLAIMCHSSECQTDNATHDVSTQAGQIMFSWPNEIPNAQVRYYTAGSNLPFNPQEFIYANQANRAGFAKSAKVKVRGKLRKNVNGCQTGEPGSKKLRKLTLASSTASSTADKTTASSISCCATQSIAKSQMVGISASVAPPNTNALVMSNQYFATSPGRMFVCPNTQANFPVRIPALFPPSRQPVVLAPSVVMSPNRVRAKSGESEAGNLVGREKSSTMLNPQPVHPTLARQRPHSSQSTTTILDVVERLSNKQAMQQPHIAVSTVKPSDSVVSEINPHYASCENIRPKQEPLNVMLESDGVGPFPQTPLFSSQSACQLQNKPLTTQNLNSCSACVAEADCCGDQQLDDYNKGQSTTQGKRTRKPTDFYQADPAHSAFNCVVRSTSRS